MQANVENNGNQSKRSRNTTNSLDAILWDKLCSLRDRVLQSLSNKPGADVRNLEVELRIGLIVQGNGRLTHSG